MQKARSTFYYYLKDDNRQDRYIHIKEAIKNTYLVHKGRYGYRRITLSIRKDGYRINHKTVYRLMGDLGLKSSIRVKKYRSYRGEHGKIAQNIIERNFKAVKPFQKWSTDVTEFRVRDKKLYLSPIIDLFNQEIISYNLSDRPNFRGIMEMLDKAIGKLDTDSSGLILHSDQGWQYQMVQYQKKLKQNGIIQSMSRKGNCLDNAIIENFFGILKSELYYQKKYESTNQLEKDIREYIEYYNNNRIKLNLNGMSPMEYRAHYNNKSNN
ncbi:integrase [Sphingobacterium sp. ML3W]|uniref:IS3 family transposase n=1 Tax=Sphingobacterium sp. ML3W TaxID=1538644 RepID=UPI0004F8F1D7|nr:IS3 family transposase [Sphingobacterium sp. ML3W]AIM38506.1 integrase [Sphingobacterium sp. ML3W]